MKSSGMKGIDIAPEGKHAIIVVICVTIISMLCSILIYNTIPEYTRIAVICSVISILSVPIVSIGMDQYKQKKITAKGIFSIIAAIAVIGILIIATLHTSL